MPSAGLSLEFDTAAPGSPELYQYSNTNWEELLPPDWEPEPYRVSEAGFSTGVILPDGFSKVVPFNGYCIRKKPHQIYRYEWDSMPKM